MPTLVREHRGAFLAWQFDSYESKHQDHRNLLFHIVTVPVFWAGNIGLFAAPLVSWWLVPLGALMMLAAVAIQGRGHAREASRPAPFVDKVDVVVRLLAEQWITFPRFVLSGGWWRALHGR